MRQAVQVEIIDPETVKVEIVRFNRRICPSVLIERTFAG
jgi:hypothetical protein